MRGARIGITAARRAQEQVAIVRSLGGVPRHGPSIDVDHPAPDGPVRRALARALAEPLDIAVFMTGVGADHLAGVASRMGATARLAAALGEAQVIARGGKPRRALRALGVATDWVADPPESRAIRDALLRRGVAGRRVLVQCAGPDLDPLVPSLRAAGASVIAVHPYDIEPPPDAGGAVAIAREAVAGELEAITFTSAHAVNGFVALADRSGLDPSRLAGSPALLVAVGPVTADALRAHGLPIDVEPAVPRMGAMYQALAARLDRRRARPA